MRESLFKDIQPFQTISGEGFVKLAQEFINMGATYGRVSAGSVLLCYRIQEQFQGGVVMLQKKKQLISQISDILKDVSMGMTTDMWTDDYRKIHYMLMTCHYITPDFKVNARVVTTAMLPLEDAKTGENW
ncbi:UNVERIFIED_CONTAM: hypothetical protein FKN15_005531 [Acipenser sinensis]